MLDLLLSFGLKFSVSSPTRVTATTRTTIDNVITNISNTVVSVLRSGISDHFTQKIVINYFTPETDSPTLKTFRVLKAQSINKLNTLLKNETWAFLNEVSCPNQKYNSFNDRLLYYLNISCPYKIINKNYKYKRKLGLPLVFSNHVKTLNTIIQYFSLQKMKSLRTFSRTIKESTEK